MLTEFGGVSFRNTPLAEVQTWGYAEVGDWETFARLYEDLLHT